MSSIEISTEDKLEYQFWPNSRGFAQFRVRAPNDAHIALSMQPAEADPMFEVFIGGWSNSKSVIRKDRTKPDVVEQPTPDILSAGEFRGFWVRWNDGAISAGREGEPQPFISWSEPGMPRFSHIGVCTGWGATGSWIMEQPSQSFACWEQAAGGGAPGNGFQVGEENGEPIYVARANLNGAVIPGKLVPSHGCCYVPWGGAEHPVQDYEVLCHFPARWEAVSGDAIPESAVRGGQTEDGEELFVGRVMHEGVMVPGKVQKSHGVCYIPYAGQEVGFPEYEVLVS